MKKIAILLFTVYCLLFIAGCGGPYKQFAKCLTDAGLVFYGTDWCGHCSNQKEMFGDDFEYITFVNCDFHSEECSEAGVIGYPTWHMNGELLDMGVQTFEELGEAAGCPVPEVVSSGE